MTGLTLVQKRKDLFKIETKMTYGFLYNGYRLPQAYFWEIVIMNRKIVIIFIQVFLAKEGKIVQALTMLVFLALNMGITSIKRPFENFWLNSLEELSLLSSTITVFCGIFFIANDQLKPD